MAQTTDYSKVDLRVGTEEQFNAKVGTLPAGTLFGITDSTVSKADLSTDLKNEINGKINKPSTPTTESAITINSSGTISTKPLTSITGKSEVYVGSTTPTNEDEILWINPNGTSGGGGSSSGGKLYRHTIKFGTERGTDVLGIGLFNFDFIDDKCAAYTKDTLKSTPYCNYYALKYFSSDSNTWFCSGTIKITGGGIVFTGIRTYGETVYGYSNSGVPLEMLESSLFSDTVIEV